jgi:CrcB protein
MNIFLIGIGGATGAILRVVLTAALPTTVLNIPLKILSVNVLGCFLAGICLVLVSVKFPNDRLSDFLISGFLGGFTTFSAFAMDAGKLYEKELLIELGCYVFASVGLSLIALFMGIKLMRWCLVG